MLEAVERNFSRGGHSLWPQEFLQLLCDFNAIAIVENKRDANLTKSIDLSTGGRSTYEHARQAVEFLSAEDCYIYYDFKTSTVMVSFTAEFKYEEVLQRLYEDYLKNPADIEALFKLCDGCSNYCHIFPDGNGRAATFMGWYLSLLQGGDYPIAIYPTLVHPLAIAEAQKWTAEFFADPEIEPMLQRSKIVMQKIIAQSRKQAPLQSCLDRIFGEVGKDVLFPLGHMDGVLFYVNSSLPDEIFISNIDRSGANIEINVSAMINAVKDVEEVKGLANVEARDFALIVLTRQRLEEAEKELSAPEKSFLQKINSFLLEERENSELQAVKKLLGIKEPPAQVHAGAAAAVVAPTTGKEQL